MSNDQEPRELLATACHILDGLGLSDYLGHPSVGQNVPEATLGAIHLERLAEVNYRVAQLGRQPRVIPPEELQALKGQLASPARPRTHPRSGPTGPKR